MGYLSSYRRSSSLHLTPHSESDEMNYRKNFNSVQMR